MKVFLVCIIGVSLSLSALSCRDGSAENRAEQAAEKVAPASRAIRTHEPAPSRPSAPFGPLAPADQVRMTLAPEEGDVTSIVRQARASAKAEKRELIVYVGATWCEPCQRFHEAAKRGELDAAFPNLTLIEFDLDHDRDRLALAGYTMQMIPYFGAPEEDGRASDRHIEGSIKGSGAVSEIAPRLRALVK